VRGWSEAFGPTSFFRQELGVTLVDMYLIIAYLATLFLCLLASLSLYFQRKENVYLKFFPPFLFVTVLMEGSSLLGLLKGTSNNVVYNFFNVIEFSFYFFVLGQIIKNKRVRLLIRIAIFLYAIPALVNIIFITTVYGFPALNMAVGCLLIVTICIYYFFELFQLPLSVALTRQPGFWICSGLLFYYSCSFPLFGPINMIRALPPFVLKNFKAIILILNVLLYSSFTIAFLCRLRTRNSMSLS
jgi:hypothetical protein